MTLLLQPQGTIMTNPTQVTWTDPATNVDGSPIAAGEITGYTVGVRDTSAPGSAAGTYPFMATAPATATSELFALLNPVLPVGKPLAVAVQANTTGPSSAWSAEADFTIAPPPPVPNPPTTISVG